MQNQFLDSEKSFKDILSVSWDLICNSMTWTNLDQLGLRVVSGLALHALRSLPKDCSLAVLASAVPVLLASDSGLVNATCNTWIQKTDIDFIWFHISNIFKLCSLIRCSWKPVYFESLENFTISSYGCGYSRHILRSMLSLFWQNSGAKCAWFLLGNC